MAAMALRLSLIAMVVSFNLCFAAEGTAQTRPSRKELTPWNKNDGAALTVTDVLKKGLGGLAREYLTPQGRQQAASDVPEGPKTGFEFELFAPGDIGATVRYRW